jgi:DNA-binding transcriptional regulator YhcF (GntR family)
MSKSKKVLKNGRTSVPRRYVMIYHWLMETEAWKSLDGNSRAIYLEMARRYAGPGSNNGQITYSARQAAENLHISKDTANRALKALQERGFIVATTMGAFSRKNRHATEWRLTEFDCDKTGDLATKDFTRWSSETHNTVCVIVPLGPCSDTVDFQEAA